jgi:hypothetical protein
MRYLYHVAMGGVGVPAPPLLQPAGGPAHGAGVRVPVAARAAPGLPQVASANQ